MIKTKTKTNDVKGLEMRKGDPTKKGRKFRKFRKQLPLYQKIYVLYTFFPPLIKILKKKSKSGGGGRQERVSSSDNKIASISTRVKSTEKNEKNKLK